MHKIMISICLFVVSLAAHAGDYEIGGFREVVITTNEPERWAQYFNEVSGWTERDRSPVDDGLKALWNTPNEAGGEQIVYANKGSDRGFVRLIVFDNIEQKYIRPNAQAWDTGGIYDFNARVSSMDIVRDSLMAQGWSAPNEPVEFKFDKFIVKQWIARGPEQTHIAFIERVEPPLEGWPNLKQTSRTFNSSQIVLEMERSVNFYQNILGFKTYVKQREPNKEPGPSAFGLPHNMAAEVVQNIHILHPGGLNEGSIELIALEGVSGANYSERALPYNLGVSALRFPVSDIDAFIADMTAKRQKLAAGPHKINLYPYGRVKSVSLVAPEGAWLDFFEAPSLFE